MRLLGTITFILLCSLLPVRNASANIIYSVNGVALVGGGDLFGTFTTNNGDTLVVSFDITAPAVGAFTGFEYTSANSAVTSQSLPGNFRIDSTVGGNELQLLFSGAGLTATGGTVSAANSYDHESSGGNRALSGPVTLGSAVPEPSTFALLGFGLVGAFVFARKKTSR
jgi:hypothetical protein